MRSYCSPDAPKDSRPRLGFIDRLLDVRSLRYTPLDEIRVERGRWYWMKIEHIAIWTYELERLRAFYERYFGAIAGERYRNDEREFMSYFLRFADGARLELMTMTGVPESTNDPMRQFTGLIHVAISVGSEAEVDRLTETLRSDGHRVLDGPRRTGDGYYESTVLDPDGNRIELTV
jgi:lactoylglutathione lyase